VFPFVLVECSCFGQGQGDKSCHQFSTVTGSQSACDGGLWKSPNSWCQQVIRGFYALVNRAEKTEEFSPLDTKMKSMRLID
jgi:hypothetical protein